MVELMNATSLTREGATQTAQNEVVLNAAYINGDWIEIEAPATDSDNTTLIIQITMPYMIPIQER